MEAGVTRSLEVEDASPTSAALMTLHRWMEQIAEKEVERITARCRRYQKLGEPVPRWVHPGIDKRFQRVEQVEQRAQMLLGIFASMIDVQRRSCLNLVSVRKPLARTAPNRSIARCGRRLRTSVLSCTRSVTKVSKQ
jgi:hypothetical protein